MTASPLSRKQARSARRADRYAARAVLWSKSSLRRVRSCGLHHQGTGAALVIDGRKGALPVGAEVKSRQVATAEPMIALKVTTTVSESPRERGFIGPGAPVSDRRAGWSGVQSCGSTWSCPVCSEKIQSTRQAETARAIAEARRKGWHVAFLTFTVRHRKDQPLKHVWAAVSTAWRASVSGSRAAWEADRTDYGVEGYLRLTEVTHGYNGWHVHVHALVFLNPEGITLSKTRTVKGERVSEDVHYPVTVDYADPKSRVSAVDALTRSMGARWADALTGTPYRPGKRHGADGRLVTSDAALPEYFAKNLYNVKSVESAAFDVTGSHAKQAKHGNATPFGILSRIVKAPKVLDTATGEEVPDYDAVAADLKLWHEWERVSKGKRQLLWSNGLRKRLGLDVEQDDQAVVDAADLDGEAVVRMTPQSYRVLARRGLLALALEHAEADAHGHRLRHFLLQQRVQYERPDTP